MNRMIFDFVARSQNQWHANRLRRVWQCHRRRHPVPPQPVRLCRQQACAGGSVAGERMHADIADWTRAVIILIVN